MKEYIRNLLLPLLLIVPLLSAQENKELEHIISCALVIHDLAKEKISDLTIDATMYEKSLGGDGNIKETKKYEKKIYLKKTADGKFRYHEEYLGFYIDGEKQVNEDLKKLARDREKRKKRRGGRDISFDITTSLRPENRATFDVKIIGIDVEPYSGLDCYLLSARPYQEKLEEDSGDSLVNYLFYIDTASFHIARVDFAPAKLVSKFMFKMKDLKMSIRYEPYDDEIWLASRFEIEGKGTAMYFMGIDFKGEELYSNPIVNGEVDEALFE